MSPKGVKYPAFNVAVAKAELVKGILALEIIRICGGGLRIRCYPREDLTHKRLSSGGKTGCYASWTSSKTLDDFWL